jgi:HAD superfamily phosphoserine phosphatase-like hydrolase
MTGTGEPASGVIATDVDGTLTWTDSLALFARLFALPAARRPDPARLGMARAAFVAEGGPLRDRIKAGWWAWGFAGMTDNTYRARAEWFGIHVMPRLVRADARTALRQRQAEGVRIIPISASCEEWMLAWARTEGLGELVIATRLERVCGRLSGRLIGRNCRGREKVRRWTDLMGPAGPDEAWGDTSGDLPLLDIAAIGRWRPFREQPFRDERDAILATIAGEARAAFPEPS